MLIRLSNPDGLAVDLEGLKYALRIQVPGEDPVTDDDATLTRLIKGETKRYEDFTGRIMLPTEMEYRIDGWEDPICIPVVPVRSVTEVIYIDENNAEQLVASSDWYEVQTDEGMEIWFVDGFDGPDLSNRQQPVRVRFHAGYDEPGVSGSGDDPETAPVEQDQVNIIRMVQRVYDLDELMPDMDMIRTMGSRRIFR